MIKLQIGLGFPYVGVLEFLLWAVLILVCFALCSTSWWWQR